MRPDFVHDVYEQIEIRLIVMYTDLVNGHISLNDFIEWGRLQYIRQQESIRTIARLRKQFDEEKDGKKDDEENSDED